MWPVGPFLLPSLTRQVFLHSNCGEIGQEDYDRLRPLSYSNADIFLVCFAVNNRNSFEKVSEKWVPELKKYCPGVPILLVGTQIDLIETSPTTKLVKPREAEALAKEIRSKYVECSAKTRDGLAEVFAEAILIALDPKRAKSLSKKKCLIS
jgi:cell division control protein 42